MSNWKDRVNKILDTETEKINAKLNEATGNYRDTGYQRYYNQIERCENELDEIETYRHARREIAQAEYEAQKLRKAITAFRDRLDAYVKEHKGIERPIEDTIANIKAGLDFELGEARARI